MGEYPGVHPLEGDYNEDTQEVIDNQLVLGNAAGVDVFAVNWYRDDYLNHAAIRIGASTSPSPIKWCLQWSNHYTSTGSANNKEYLYEGMRRASVRMTGSRYWLKGGLPVFIMFSGLHLLNVLRNALGQPNTYVPTSAERTALIQDLHKIVKNVKAGDLTGGISGTLHSASVSGTYTQSMYFVLMDGDIGSWGTNNVTGISALTAYNQRTGTFNGTTRLARTYPELMEASVQVWKLNTNAIAINNFNVKYWPCVMAGRDNRPWGGTASDPLSDNSTPTVNEFKQHCIAAKNFCADYMFNTDQTVFLYAWNEFGEGGYIAPSVKYGTALGDIVKIHLD